MPAGLVNGSLRSEYLQPQGGSVISVLFRLISKRLQVVAMASLAKVSCGFTTRTDGSIASEYFPSLIRSGEDRALWLNCREPKTELPNSEDGKHWRNGERCFQLNALLWTSYFVLEPMSWQLLWVSLISMISCSVSAQISVSRSPVEPRNVLKLS